MARTRVEERQSPEFVNRRLRMLRGNGCG